jgi:hypothetical protein
VRAYPSPSPSPSPIAPTRTLTLTRCVGDSTVTSSLNIELRASYTTGGSAVDEFYCKEKCKDRGFCCNDPSVSSNRLLSCAQACMIRARGANEGTCGLACDAQATSRGCSRTVSGHTYSMCSSCSDLDDSSPLCGGGVPSVDACHAGCAIAPATTWAPMDIAAQCCAANDEPSQCFEPVGKGPSASVLPQSLSGGSAPLASDSIVGLASSALERSSLQHKQNLP